MNLQAFDDSAVDTAPIFAAGKRRSLLVAALCSAVTPHTAQAQAELTLEPIIVTAQRRAQDIREVPMSITAITAEDLRNLGAVQFKDYAVSVPSLSFGFKGGEARGSGNTIAIRGVSGTNTTGYYIDDTPIPAGVDPHLADVEQIEVLRGPQGTLYGSGSMGGTIKLVSVQPETDGFRGTAQGTVSSSNEASALNYVIDTSLNVPLSATTALLISGFSEQRAGVFDRIVGETLPYYPDGVISSAPGRKSNVDELRVYGGRISLLWAANDMLRVMPTLHYQKTSTDGISAADTAPDNFSHYRAYDIDEPFDEEYSLVNLTIKLSLESAELTSSTSYLDRTFGEIEDSTEVIDTFLRGLYGNPDAPMFPSPVFNDRDQEQFTQELRLTGDSERFRWLVGAFYEQADITRSASIVYPGISSDPDYFDFGTDIGFFSDDGRRATEKALFTDVSWSATEKLELSAGVRYFDSNVEGFRKSGGFLDAETNLGPADLNQSETGTTPRFAAKFQISERAMVYATAAQGFRPGGFSTPLPDACDDDLIEVGFVGEPGAFDSDSLWNYEGGVKSTWLGGRVSVDAAAFRIDWTEIQQQIRLGCGFGVNANVGEAQITGFEIEARATPGTGLELGLGVSLNDSEITDPGVNTPADKGDELLDTPQWQVNANVQYTLAAMGQTDLYMRADYRYNSRSFSTFNQDDSPTGEPFLPREAFDIVDVRTALHWPERDLEIAVFVQNVFDENANFGPYQSIGVDFPGRPRLATNRPRTIGLSVRKSF